MAQAPIGTTDSYFQFYYLTTYGNDNLYSGIQILYGLDWTSIAQNYTGYDIRSDTVDANFYGAGGGNVPVWIWAALNPRIVDPSIDFYTMSVGDTIEIALTDDIGSAEVYQAGNPGGNNGKAIAFLGPGDDTINGGVNADLLVGGDGNDQILGYAGNDTIYGDYSNLPVYEVVKIAANYNATPQSPAPGPFFQPNLPSQDSVARSPINPYDSEPTGDDVIDGGDGQDTIYGGPGADNLSGGPRGQSGSDVVFGGADADIFNIATNIPATDSSDPGASNGFWGTYGGDIVGGGGSSATSSIIKTITKSVLPDVMEGAVGGFVFSSITGIASSLVGASLKNLFSHSAPTPKPTVSGNDILIVADFDPREDTLYLPVNEILEIDARVITTVSSGNELLPPDETYGVTSLEFFFPGEATEDKVTSQNAQVGDVTFARVIFSADYLTALGIDETTAPADQVALFENVLSQEFVVGDDAGAGGNTSGTGLQLPIDSGSYVNGEVPESVGDPDSLGLQAPSNSKAVVFGAFAPWSIINPAVSSSVPSVAGTNLSDILNVNARPLNVISPINTEGLTTTSFEVFGFGGDDIIVGGTGNDVIYGGDGDDIIYDLGGQGGSKTQETLEGGSGDDLVYAGINTTTAFYNGGDGNDTIDFVYLTDDDLVVDLSTTIGTATSYDNNDIETLYQLSNVENVTGSPQSDRITGSIGANVFGYSRSDDVIDGGGGDDTYSFSNWVPFTSTTTIGATINIANGAASGEKTLTASLLDAVANEQQNSSGDLEWVYINTPVTFTDTLTDVETLVGTIANDTINGSLSSGALRIEGAGGDDVVTSGSDDDVLDGGPGADRLLARGGADRVFGGDGSDFLGGGRGDDFLVGGAGELDVLRGGPGKDIFAFRDELRNGVHEQDLVQDFDPLEDAIDLGGHRVNSYVEMAGSLLLMVGRDQDAILLRGVSDIDSVFLLNEGETPIGPLGADAEEYDFVVTERNPGLGLPRIAASSADDLVLGTARDETLKGVGGNDLLLGFDGSDYVAGGRGDDIIFGGAGLLDTLRGGPGADVFVFRDELRNGVHEEEIIQDFDPLEDAIDLGGYRIASHEEMADSLLLTVGPDGDEILLRGVTDIDSIVVWDGREPGTEQDAPAPMQAEQQPDWLA